MLAGNADAQKQPDLTAEDYKKAEKFLAYNTQNLVDNVTGKPTWFSGEKFWYRTLTAQGSEFIVVDVVKAKRLPAFNHQKLAEAISSATGKNYSAFMLPFQSIGFSPDEKYVTFSQGNKDWKFDLKSGQLTSTTKAISDDEPRSESLSPDGKKAVYIKDNNLWVRDMSTNQSRQLTTDGVKDFGYATDNAGWRHSDRPIVLWSPDSKKIFTYQQDERKVGDMFLVTTNVGHPKLESWKYPLPGDSVIAMLHRVIIDVESPAIIRLKISPDAHRATLGDDISRGGVLSDAEWSENGSQLAFVSTSRDHKQEKFRIADALTGDVKEIFEETSKTQFESGHKGISWRFLPSSKEFIWYSERDNWGHLYLYDAESGKLKNQITEGDWLVTQVLKIDEKSRVVYFMANAKEPGNPYFSHFYKIGFDGKNLVSLTPEPGMHSIILSSSGNYFVDSYSQPDVPVVTVLRNTNGKLILPLEKMDLTRLKTAGWKAPIPFSVKAHDGKTDLYGLMYTPTNMDSTRKYPIVDYIYPGPQGGSIGSWAFNASRRDNQALAELGFVVMELEGTSNPSRSKSFHDMSYGNMADNTLPDQVSAIRQLAGRHNWMDTSRVGMHGHSGGGFATACAMFMFPDFFKVGISESGNHDNRNYEDDWGERYIGLLTETGKGVSNYENQANQVHAKNLKGKLMLAHGMMDDNVPPYNTMLVVEALEKANKDYDLVIFPNSRHGYGSYNPYMMRKRWDYFVKNLLGVEPPKEYLLQTNSDPRNSVR